MFLLNATATTEIYTYCHTLSLHDALPISALGGLLGVMFSIPLRRALVAESDLPYPEGRAAAEVLKVGEGSRAGDAERSEEHTSELQSLMRISYAVFCLKKKRYEDITSANK